MRLQEALYKYNADQYKRSELVKGKLAVRRIPFAFTKQGNIETFLRDAIDTHVQRYRLGTTYGIVGYLIDSELDAPTLRCSAITFTRAERPILTDETDFVISPPDLAIEFINQPDVKEYDLPLPAEHENEDSDSYWAEKLADYRRFGVNLVWIIDLTSEVIHEFRQPEWKSITLKHGDSLNPAEFLPGFRCKVEDIFSLEKLRSLFNWETPVDGELVKEIAQKHREAGLIRKQSVAEKEWNIIQTEEDIRQTQERTRQIQQETRQIEEDIRQTKEETQRILDSIQKELSN